MTTSELKKYIIKSDHYEWFKNIECKFDFTHLGEVYELKGITSIFQFVSNQLKDWKTYNNKIPADLKTSVSYFENIKLNIEALVDYNYDLNRVINYWHNSINTPINQANSYFTFNSAYTQYLLKIYIEYPSYFQGAFNLINNKKFDISSKNLLFGTLLSYEFEFKEKSDLTKRKDVEKQSLSKLKTEFSSYINKSESQLLEHFKNSEDNYLKHLEILENYSDEKKKIFETWLRDTQYTWDKWFSDTKIKLQKIEETYETKLKLEKPAKYWDKKSLNYQRQANNAKTALYWIIIPTTIIILLLLFVSPKYIFDTVFEGNKVAIIRWSFLFITFLSLVAYSIKLVSKFMMSSYHLARDAEERHTLTFFYLALLKDTQVKDEDRNLILKSLFSRAETGLLKDDASPTMPSDAISKILTKPN